MEIKNLFSGLAYGEDYVNKILTEEKFSFLIYISAEFK